MACNVCGEETGWAENPLVYCDGNDGHCSVAVHQACYGIISVPSGAWLCGKCVSLERKAKVRCELCPNKDGAFKRTNTGNFAHVVCALYIPEARFGDVMRMEPIILSSIPPDRFHKTCYICEDRNRDNKAKLGACMQCNKSGCKQYFHVTCAQTQGLLCEEASNNDDNVKYCGYCKHHYQKMRKDHHIKFIPAFKPETRSEKDNSSPEKRDKKSHHNSDTSKPPKKKQKFYGTGTSSTVDSDVELEKETKSKRKRTNSNKDLSSLFTHNKQNLSKEMSSLFDRESDLSSNESNIAPVNKKLRENSSKTIFDSDTDEEIHYKKSKSTDPDKKKSKKISSKNKETEKSSHEKQEKRDTKKVKKRKEDSSSSKVSSSKPFDKDEIPSKISSKSDEKKSDEKRSSIKSNNSQGEINVVEKTNGDKIPEPETVEETCVKSPTIVQADLPKNDFDLPEVIKHSSFYEEETNKTQNPIQTFEELLERQWNQSAQFLMEQRFDISSLISCLYRLKSENRYLDEKLRNLTQKRDHLMSMNSKLAIPLNAIANGLESWESSNNQLTNTSNNNGNKSNESTSNLFFNQNTLAQANFSSIHNTATNVASTSSPNTNLAQKANSTGMNSNHSTNFFNYVSNNLNSTLNNNQSFKSSIDLNSNNLNTSFFDSSSLKQNSTSSGFHYNNSIFHNGQFINTSTSSPSKLNTSSFNNNSLANSANNGNIISPALLQNFIHNQQAAFSQINQQSVQNSLNGGQSKR